MIRVGLTGGIGSGKSTVAKLLEVMGLPVFYADYEAKYLMRTDEELKEKIIRLLGSDAYKKTELNRVYIAKRVFGNSDLLNQLNRIVHPAVRNHFETWCTKFVDAHVLIQEAAILFENDSHHYFDKTILVTAPEHVRIDRVMKRDESSEMDIRARIANQWSDDKKKTLADFVISNNNDELLIVQLSKIIKSL
ncbi:dephospho-CoA kinase [Carboxylicivirga sp. N1Y90]|uniref:dephospho-CoA kinase n=1 Tax=Carboxylicivirga fragile TaxID=3417571 RepID=UPI003D33C1A4|nr:dephospho-CoA kinase [Marinilabiliaceae bacterium N1Y90]